MSCISLKILVASMMFNLLSMPISSGAAVVFGYIALISSILLPFELMRYNGVCVNKKQFGIVLVLVGIVCLNSFVSLTVIKVSELEDLGKAIISFFSFLFSIMAKDVLYTEKDLKFFFSVTRFFAVIMILYTIIPFDFQYVVINEYGGTQFTLSMGNPNATATKLLFGIVVLGVENSMLKSKYWRWCNGGLIMGLFYVIFRLQSRTALICALIFIVYGMLLKVRIKKWMIDWVWLVPVIFIPFQLWIARQPAWDFLDKSMTTGREELFANFINLISFSPTQFILGDFAKYQLVNNHNIIFSLIFNFGFLGVGVFLWFWKIEGRGTSEITTKIAQYAWMGFFIFVIHSMAESAVLSGAFTFSVILVLINRLTKDKIVFCPGEVSKYDWTIEDTYAKEGEYDESVTRN